MLFDAHCHPTDAPGSLNEISNMDAKLCIMTTRFDDLDLVKETARSNSGSVIPAFGLHPWYSHVVTFGGTKEQHYTQVFGEIDPKDLVTLPDPVPWSLHLDRIKAALIEFPSAVVGEIGLDKAFRVKIDDQITKYKTSMDHQRRVFRSQLELAAELNRGASVHGVQCHMPLLEDCTSVINLYPHTGMRICLHSFGGTPDFASQRWIKLRIPIFFSVAVLINAKSRPKALSLIRSLPHDRLLSESDYHEAGSYMMELLEQSVSLLREGGVTGLQIERNFNAFIRL